MASTACVRHALHVGHKEPETDETTDYESDDAVEHLLHSDFERQAARACRVHSVAAALDHAYERRDVKTVYCMHGGHVLLTLSMDASVLQVHYITVRPSYRRRGLASTALRLLALHVDNADNRWHLDLVLIRNLVESDDGMTQLLARYPDTWRPCLWHRDLPIYVHYGQEREHTETLW